MTEAVKTIDDGGQAFPVTFEGGSNNGDSPFFHEGMSLRDRFALEVINHVLYEGHTDQTGSYADAAARAYEFADAMIAARKAGA